MSLDRIPDRHSAGLSKLAHRMRDVLRYYAEKGTPLEKLADRRYIGRKLPTLKKWAKQFGITFPDYKPRRQQVDREAA
jgi:hypothetical protein